MTFPLRQRGSILCGTRFTKSGQEPYCVFERHYVLMESGSKIAMFSGRAVYVIGSLQLTA
jgi:hypothetical protein